MSDKEDRVNAIKADLLQRYRRSGAGPLVEELLGSAVANLVYSRTEAEVYHIVGVEPGDPQELIHQVYRVKAAFWHPDNKASGDPEMFKRLQSAYERLSRRG